MPLAQYRFYASDVTPHLFHPCRVLDLSVSSLEPEVENFPAEVVKLLG
jgi:hypothetical protein